MLTLYIGNKNYSSWSLRPWLLMRVLGIPFEERLLRFGDLAAWQAASTHLPSGRVPMLVDGERRVWDSLAIVEYLAETHPGVWPGDGAARAWARSAAAEMHSGFSVLRQACSMNVGVRVKLHEQSPKLQHDLARIDALWRDGLDRFGGPFLAGERFTAVDAFFAPVCFRVATYDLALSPAATAWQRQMLALPQMRQWEAAALAEDFRDEAHEAELAGAGDVVADRRARNRG